MSLSAQSSDRVCLSGQSRESSGPVKFVSLSDQTDRLEVVGTNSSSESIDQSVRILQKKSVCPSALSLSESVRVSEAKKNKIESVHLHLRRSV